MPTQTMPNQAMPTQAVLTQGELSTQGVHVVVHGHFYQPPRENPYLESIERQAGAAPFHDWNERIYWECYRPNAFARILTSDGAVMAIVNNFEHLSFNVGPTLMSWLEAYDGEVYERILAGDRASCQRLQGHGNAIAQVYNHVILPLANSRDKRTQIRWGKADFRHRFGREPEGMWLAETAVDAATLQILVEEGIRFIILAPSQAQRCRPLNRSSPWQVVSGGQIDPSRPYRCFLRQSLNTPVLNPSGLDTLDPGSASPYLDIFFYDEPISRDLGFDDLLSHVGKLTDRLKLAVKGDGRSSQVIGVATDGETFGHHKKGTEKCLAYGFTQAFAQAGWTVTNFAHYLSLHPPTWEVELKPVTAWSCSHGVDRWQTDCGCGKVHNTHQRWRQPLRAALDWLRDSLSQIYETEGARLLQDPWQAREAYVDVIRDRHPTTIEQFLSQHQIHDLKAEEQIDVLRLLEMQRYALLMYTSCGWFFEELSRPEGVQILCYAARALELAGDVTGLRLEPEFLHRLALAPTNAPQLPTGAAVYEHLVKSTQITIEHIAAHYAISSLLTDHAPNRHPFPPVPSLSAVVATDTLPLLQQQRIYCYTVYTEDYQQQRLGSLALAVGQIRLVSEITWETSHLMFTVLHLGGWDFHCCVQPFSGRLHYTELKQSLFQSLHQGSAAQTILTMNRLLRNPHCFGLQDLFAEERHRIMRWLTEETLDRLNQLYSQVYRSNYGILMAFHRDGLEVPHELQVAAEVALSHRVLTVMRGLEQQMNHPSLRLSQSGQSHVVELEEIAPEVEQLQCHLNLPEARNILERLLVRTLWQLSQTQDPVLVQLDVRYLKRLLTLGNTLQLYPSLAKAQEFFHYHRSQQSSPQLESPHWLEVERLLCFSI